MESINGLYKAECIRTTVFHEGPYRTIIDVEFATAGWVEILDSGDVSVFHVMEARQKIVTLVEEMRNQ